MFTKEEAFAKVSELVERFAAQIESYKTTAYNETLTRKDFIDPFFEALGWDMNNRQGAWEAYREVIHEDKLKIGGVTTAPDYSFRLIGGQRLFFVEAKKPSILIKDDLAPAYQVRLYGWNAKLAISVVTDFEEFAIYECTKKPLKNDKASKARINYFTYKDYLKEFDFFWNTFSKQQVIKGGLIKFQQRDKKGTATVDKDFLENLDKWRKELAANIYKNNPDVGEDELNYAVQQTIDRIIFLRIAEDRGLEPYGQLKSSLQNDEQYKELYRQFRVADDKYNSGLFHFKKEKDNNKEPDNISGRLIIENKVIKSIISSLYPPQSEYLFNVLPVEILGSAYEQFLGKQIIVKGSRATIEDKPEVRKAGGVFYTPQYIVEYIVENTVGKLCAAKTPKEISKIKIVDPACGSGSFLLGAYQYLLKWHMIYYAENPQTGKQKDAVLTPDGSLTTAEKKRILLNNIYGVDIDRNAVEVTKLSLLLKCMEGETTASINTQMTFFHERVLPSLENNIKSGNSLIDVDFYDTEFDFGEEKKIKPFNWQQAFPNVFTPSLRGGTTKQSPDGTTGFDAVIGNPPYVRPHNIQTIYKNYLWNNYKTFKAKSDLYSCFMEKGLNICKEDGLFSFIVPQTWTSLESFLEIRKYIFNNSFIKILTQLPRKVFQDATVETCVFLIQKTNKQSKKNNVLVEKLDELSTRTAIREFPQNDILNTHLYNFQLFGNTESKSFTDKLVKFPKLENFVDFKYGFKTADDEKFISNNKLSKDYKPFIRSADIKRYSNNNPKEYVLYLPQKMIANRKTARPGDKERFENEKLMIARMGKTIAVNFDSEKLYIKDAMLLINKSNLSLKYILAILNSKLIEHYYQRFFITIDVLKNAILSLPIKPINFTNKQDKSLHNEIVQLVETMLQLNKEKQQTTLPDKLDQLNTRIKYTDDKINKLVYQLYGLSEEEIGVIELKAANAK